MGVKWPHGTGRWNLNVVALSRGGGLGRPSQGPLQITITFLILKCYALLSAAVLLLIVWSTHIISCQ